MASIAGTHFDSLDAKPSKSCVVPPRILLSQVRDEANLLHDFVRSTISVVGKGREPFGLDRKVRIPRQ